MAPWPCQDRPHVLAKPFQACPIPIRYSSASSVVLLTFLLERKPNRAREAVSAATSKVRHRHRYPGSCRKSRRCPGSTSFVSFSFSFENSSGMRRSLSNQAVPNPSSHPTNSKLERRFGNNPAPEQPTRKVGSPRRRTPPAPPGVSTRHCCGRSAAAGHRDRPSPRLLPGPGPPPHARQPSDIRSP